jgi:hypothetical protein
MQLNGPFFTPQSFDAAVRQFETATEQRMTKLRERVKQVEAAVQASAKGRPLHIELPPLAKRVRKKNPPADNRHDSRLRSPEELKRILVNHNQVLEIDGQPGVFFTAETQSGECGPKSMEISATLLISLFKCHNPQVPGKMSVYRECVDSSQNLYHILDPILTYCAAVELNVLPMSKQELDLIKDVIFESIDRTNQFTICFEWNDQKMEFRYLNYYLFKMLAAVWTNTPCSILAKTPLHHSEFLLNPVICVNQETYTHFLPLNRSILNCLHPSNFKNDLSINPQLAWFIIPAFAARIIELLNPADRDVELFYEVTHHLYNQKFQLNYANLHHVFIRLLPRYLALHNSNPPPIELHHLKSGIQLSDYEYLNKIKQPVLVSQPQIVSFSYGSTAPVIDDTHVLNEAANEFQKEAEETEKRLASLEKLIVELEQRYLKPQNPDQEVVHSRIDEKDLDRDYHYIQKTVANITKEQLEPTVNLLLKVVILDTLVLVNLCRHYKEIEEGIFFSPVASFQFSLETFRRKQTLIHNLRNTLVSKVELNQGESSLLKKLDLVALYLRFYLFVATNHADMPTYPNLKQPYLGCIENGSAYSEVRGKSKKYLVRDAVISAFYSFALSEPLHYAHVVAMFGKRISLREKHLYLVSNYEGNHYYAPISITDMKQASLVEYDTQNLSISFGTYLSPLLMQRYSSSVLTPAQLRHCLYVENVILQFFRKHPNAKSQLELECLDDSPTQELPNRDNSARLKSLVYSLVSIDKEHEFGTEIILIKALFVIASKAKDINDLKLICDILVDFARFLTGDELESVMPAPRTLNMQDIAKAIGDYSVSVLEVKTQTLSLSTINTVIKEKFKITLDHPTIISLN